MAFPTRCSCARATVIPGVPEHTLKVQAEWRVIRGLTLGASLAYASGVFARGDENNQDVNGKVPGYALVQLDASYVLVKGLRLSVKVDNLFDTSYSNFGVLGESALHRPGA
jgi:iron complex outermembrane recepter protein